jgi:hypothetical protein
MRDDERQFWAKAESIEYVDWPAGKRRNVFADYILASPGLDARGSKGPGKIAAIFRISRSSKSSWRSGWHRSAGRNHPDLKALPNTYSPLPPRFCYALIEIRGNYR